MTGRFEGRVALVTGGAGSAIGGATCRRLASEGAAVVVMDHHERRTDETVEALRSRYDVPIMGAPADVHCYTPSEFERRREQLPAVRRALEHGLELTPAAA